MASRGVGFDAIVVTAANEAQAKGYRAMVAPLVGRLAPTIEVVPDPGGRRVGSLLSTVEVLRRVDCRGRRVLVCHSGGDSRRLPAYAAIGKAFVPVPQPDGSAPSLFEVIVRNMARLRLPRRGLLVVCGDVAPSFDFAACDFAPEGVTGVAYRDTMDEGSRHGVYVPRADGTVAGFLQKPTAAAAKAAGALVRGKVAVDTGILWIGPKTCDRMLARYGGIDPAAVAKPLDIYEDFTADLLGGLAPFRVNVVPRCDFFHVGSTAELLARLGGGRAWVEACALPREEMKLGGRNVVTFVPREYGPVRLDEGECLTCLPVGRRRWVPVRYREDDDFKRDGKWEAFGLGRLMPQVDHARLLALRDEAVVELPLRIDLAGGWSDTPPICTEAGGQVLNFAVSFSGRRPVRVRVRRLAEREVRVESADLRERGVLRTLEEIRAPKDPHDWCALIKSALVVTGFDFDRGGLDIRISADVPKGSGMGTSSILGAALVKALLRVRGEYADAARVSDLTLALEREMQTGGGWQDQLGGLLPGVKLLSSRRGESQKVSATPLDAASTARFAAFLKDRALLYFTGRKRMARNVLRGVIGFYREDPDGIARAIVRRLKEDAARAFAAIRAGDWEALAAALNACWQSKKALDPGSTNSEVESIVARIAPWTSAVTLCGAGGGGFMFVIARDRAARRRIRQTLERHPPLKGGFFQDFEIWNGD